MKHLLVKDWMKTDVISAAPKMPMLKAHKLMRDNNIRYHFMAEVERDGFDAVAQRIFKELKGK